MCVIHHEHWIWEGPRLHLIKHFPYEIGKFVPSKGTINDFEVDDTIKWNHRKDRITNQNYHAVYNQTWKYIPFTTNKEVVPPSTVTLRGPGIVFFAMKDNWSDFHQQKLGGKAQSFQVLPEASWILHDPTHLVQLLVMLPREYWFSRSHLLIKMDTTFFLVNLRWRSVLMIVARDVSMWQICHRYSAISQSIMSGWHSTRSSRHYMKVWDMQRHASRSTHRGIQWVQKPGSAVYSWSLHDLTSLLKVLAETPHGPGMNSCIFSNLCVI